MWVSYHTFRTERTTTTRQTATATAVAPNRTGQRNSASRGPLVRATLVVRSMTVQVALAMTPPKAAATTNSNWSTVAYRFHLGSSESNVSPKRPLSRESSAVADVSPSPILSSFVITELNSMGRPRAPRRTDAPMPPRIPESV